MEAEPCPPPRSVFPRPRLRRVNAREAAVNWHRLPRDETSAADKLLHCSGSPIAARRIPRCGRRETAGRWGAESLPREVFPRRIQKKPPKSAASAPRVRPRGHPPPPAPPPPPFPPPIHLRRAAAKVVS